jgi:hypothetical protein
MLFVEVSVKGYGTSHSMNVVITSEYMPAGDTKAGFSCAYVQESADNSGYVQEEKLTVVYKSDRDGMLPSPQP